MKTLKLKTLERAYLGELITETTIKAWGSVDALESALATMRHCEAGTPAPCDDMTWEPTASAMDSYGTSGIFGRWTSASLIAKREESFAAIPESFWS